MTPYVPNCAVPLLFENEYEEAPYGIAGTGFLVQWCGSLYFVTAEHCLRPGDHNRLRVPATLESGQILKLKEFANTSLPTHEDDTDHADFSLFSVEPAHFGPRAATSLEPVTMPDMDTTPLLRKEIFLTARGYPKAAPLSRIDYTRMIISTQALTCDAAYLGSATSKFCHDLQFIDTCPISDLNYMSGSPVFAKCKHHGAEFYLLVGLLLRAGGPDRLGHFVSIECIKEGLRRFMAQNAQWPKP